MKKYLTFFSLILFSVDLMAADRISPTMYECEGSRNTRVSFTTTSFIGKPTIRVAFEGRDVKLPAFPEIKNQPTVLGSLVSVSDMRLVPVDGPELRYTLVLPMVFLRDSSGVEKFETMLVRTSVANPFFRPTPFTGVTEHNSFVEVRCTAKRVVF